MITYATVCSGVEGCSLALDGMGWKPIFFCEIEPFPCAVLKHHYPNVPNLGDMSKISYNKETGVITNGTTNIEFRGQLDLLAGGTPCQDFSVAGKRSGAAEGSGTRSSLMWEWLRLAKEFRPRILLWENVVGAFSTNGGRDFHALVRAIDALGYCVAWRVLDAQFTRVDRWPMAIPQRRRRVWLVGCLGGDVADIAKILFESSSITGDTPPRRISREKVAKAAQDRDREHASMVGDSMSSRMSSTGKNVASTLSADDCTHSGQDYKNSSVIETYKIPSMASNVMKSATPETGVRKVDVASTLDTSTQSPTKAQGGEMIVGTLDLVGGKAGVNFGDGDISPTLTHGRGSASDIHAVAAGVMLDAHTGFPTAEGISQTLKNGNSPGWANGVVEKVEGIDGYNFSQTGDASATIRGTACDFQHTNGVVVKNSNVGVSSMNFELYDTAKEVSVCLNARRAQDTIINTPLPGDGNEASNATNFGN